MTPGTPSFTFNVALAPGAPVAPRGPVRPIEPSLPLITTDAPSLPFTPILPSTPLAPSLPTVISSDRANSTFAPLVSLVCLTVKFLPAIISTVFVFSIVLAFTS